MQEIKNLAINLFELEQPVACKCDGGHLVCIRCKPCRINQPDQVVENPEACELNQYIDHTVLKADTLKSAIKKLSSEADQYRFKSVCVNPCFVKVAKFHCNHSLVCSVIGFPLGANTLETKLFETKKAIEEGANEIDMVINIGLLKGKEYIAVMDEIFQIKQVCHKNSVLLKVIIETALLDKTEKIIACLLAKKSGADFVKTSTGFSTHGATIDDVSLMRMVVGKKMGVKASGGIRTLEECINMIKAGANRIGSSNGVIIMNEKEKK